MEVRSEASWGAVRIAREPVNRSRSKDRSATTSDGAI